MTDTFVVVTRKGKLRGAAVTYYLTIDGATDTIKGGQTVQARLKPGSHQIELEVTGVSAKRVVENFDITSGQTVEYDIGFSAWSGVKLDRVR